MKVKLIRTAVLTIAILAMLFMATPKPAHAATCTATGTNVNWSANGSWTGCGGVTPTSTDDVVIPSGTTVKVNVNPTVLSITINSGGTLKDNGTAATITL